MQPPPWHQMFLDMWFGTWYTSWGEKDEPEFAGFYWDYYDWYIYVWHIGPLVIECHYK